MPLAGRTESFVKMSLRRSPQWTVVKFRVTNLCSEFNSFPGSRFSSKDDEKIFELVAGHLILYNKNLKHNLIFSFDVHLPYAGFQPIEKRYKTK